MWSGFTLRQGDDVWWERYRDLRMYDWVFKGPGDGLVLTLVSPQRVILESFNAALRQLQATWDACGYDTEIEAFHECGNCDKTPK